MLFLRRSAFLIIERRIRIISARRLLDFAFLSKRNLKAFPYAKAEKLKVFVFFLEIKLADDSFVTIRRKVANPSKVSFNICCLSDQDFTDLSQQD